MPINKSCVFFVFFFISLFYFDNFIVIIWGSAVPYRVNMPRENVQFERPGINSHPGVVYW